MLVIVFIFLSTSLYIFNNALCNFIVHPSLADIFIENVRENIFISPTKVTSKKLTTPYCSSDDDSSCHNINTWEYPFSQNGEYILENYSDEKVAYMHTTPFYNSILNDEIGIDIDLEIEKEEQKEHKKEKEILDNKNDNNIFYSSINFILDNVSIFFNQINKNKTSTYNQLLYPSDFIDMNKTYILSKSNQINKNNKQKIKGSCLGEHIDDLKTYSFIEPLSLAIDEIDFNSFFENIWNENRFNYIFLKEDKKNENINNIINDQNNYLINNYENMKKEGEIDNLTNYNLDTQANMTYRKNHIKENILENSIYSNIYTDDEIEYFYRHSNPEIFWKINNATTGTSDSNKPNEYPKSFDLNFYISKVLKQHHIIEETDFEQVLMNNKKVNIGICVKEKKKKKKKFVQLFKNNLKNARLKKFIDRKKLKKYIYGKRKSKKREREYTCVFFKSMEKFELIFYGNKNGEKKSLKFSDQTLYKEWKDKNLNKSKLSMLSTNILNNLNNYDYQYNKYIYKLHTDFTGVCKMVAPINMYKNKMFLNVLFNINICYNSDYISKDIYFDVKAKEDIILGGVWSYGNPKRVRNVINMGEKNENKNEHIYRDDRIGGSNLTESVANSSNNDYVNKFNDLNRNRKEKSRIYIMEKVLNPNVDPSKRFKRMKKLNLYKNKLDEKVDEKLERSYIIKSISENNNGILLLSKKGFLKFKTPIVLSELYIEIHQNPLYNLICKNENIAKLQSSFSSNANKEEVKPECKYKNVEYVYLFFNFYLNDNNKFSIKIDVNIDDLKRDDNNSTPVLYLNVLNYLKNNIHQYRINRIEIEYSFYPILQKNAFFDHINLPFYISLNNIIINKSEKIYNYVPIFYTAKDNFLKMLRSFKSYQMKSNQDIYKSGKISGLNNNACEDNIGSEQNEWIDIFNSLMNNEEDDLDDDDEDYIFSDVSNRGNSTNIKDDNEIGKNRQNNTYQDYPYFELAEKDGRNRSQIFNSFSIFTSLNEKIFYRHVTKYTCTNSVCISLENDHLKYNFYKNNGTSYDHGKKNRRSTGRGNAKLELDDKIEILPSFEINNNIVTDKMQKEYFDSLRKELEHYELNNVENIVAYNMKKLYFYEYIDKKYIIPPYIKGIIINYEKKNANFIYDLYSNLLYIIQPYVEKNYYDTRTIFDTIYIYTALIPIESDLYNFNFLSENNLTLKQMQSQNTQTIFKNVIPLTKYEDYYTPYINQPNIIKIKIMDLNLNDITEQYVELTQGEGYQKIMSI
ncbi:conserved Plasmodium protein, unknown function [Plasmodium vinckei vinckei]|uniref:Uncharacterized protein n=1 Tax=Plasmodium vinckei vinckei TaxID=54757 RepID=A0A449BQ84_PLAVN|nr:conserved Plasmodium protein, unknown function [Plasmodium vinckei vinckei]VEV55548.1 conserved Plasmodium protein, unknown function [Plasmodium vinckei vinckei]